MSRGLSAEVANRIAALATRVTMSYARFSHLAGGVVLPAIGALLLLRPEWLMFG